VIYVAQDVGKTVTVQRVISAWMASVSVQHHAIKILNVKMFATKVHIVMAYAIKVCSVKDDGGLLQSLYYQVVAE